MKLLETHLAENGLDQKHIDLLLTIAQKFKAGKGERLLTPTHISDRMYYLTSGIIREYEILETETERTYWFEGGGNWFFSTQSYISGKPSTCYLQAIEDTEGYYFYKSELEELLKIHAPLSFLAYKLCHGYIQKIRELNKILQLSKFSERLARFEQLQPDLDGRIKQKMLASFLRVRPEQISRLRTERAKGKRM